MPAYSFGNRWVGQNALHEPPAVPSMQEIAKKTAAGAPAEGRSEALRRFHAGATPSRRTSEVPERVRADLTYLDLGDGVTCTVSEAQSMLRQMIKTMKRSGRAEQAAVLRAVQRQMIRGDLDIDASTRSALRRGMLAGRTREIRASAREARMQAVEERQWRSRRRR